VATHRHHGNTQAPGSRQSILCGCMQKLLVFVQTMARATSQWLANGRQRPTMAGNNTTTHPNRPSRVLQAGAERPCHAGSGLHCKHRRQKSKCSRDCGAGHCEHGRQKPEGQVQGMQPRLPLFFCECVPPQSNGLPNKKKKRKGE
jgi:hypothetical protein